MSENSHNAIRAIELLEVTKMARKFVLYTGDTKEYPRCSKPNFLVKGHVYEVVQIINLGTQVNYRLRGLEGFAYPSNWFKAEKEANYKHRNTFHGVAHEKPILGKQYRCYLLDGNNLITVLTSTVEGYEQMQGGICYVRTMDSQYYINIV